MDAGLAAVLGAAVGALGTALAAWITGRWSAKNAQRQMEAQERQAELQHRRDHHREGRVPRQQAYADLIMKTSQFLDRVVGREGITLQEYQDLHRVLAMVELEGPSSIVDATKHLGTCLHNCWFAGIVTMSMTATDLESAQREADRRRIRHARDVTQALEAFTARARRVLEDLEA